MVMPEREMPGIMAKPWVRPRTSASFRFKVFLFACINFLVSKRIMPVIIKAAATNFGEANNLSKKSFPDKPMMPVIRVTIII